MSLSLSLPLTLSLTLALVLSPSSLFGSLSCSRICTLFLLSPSSALSLFRSVSLCLPLSLDLAVARSHSYSLSFALSLSFAPSYLSYGMLSVEKKDVLIRLNK